MGGIEAARRLGRQAMAYRDSLPDVVYQLSSRTGRPVTKGTKRPCNGKGCHRVVVGQGFPVYCSAYCKSNRAILYSSKLYRRERFEWGLLNRIRQQQGLQPIRDPLMKYNLPRYDHGPKKTRGRPILPVNVAGPSPKRR